MEYKQIQELIKMVNKSNVSELSIEQGDFKITIKQQQEVPAVQSYMPPVQHVVQAAPVQVAAAAPAAAAPAATAAKPAAEANADQATIKSPMIGTFYRSPSPDKPVFVNIGDEVKKGQVLCIIEAMKLFNEIESEMDCRIVKVLVDDSSPVEYDQQLFIVEPL